MTDLVQVTDDGPVRLVRMNRPGKKNALTQEMYTGLAQALESAAADPAVRCTAIVGVPGAFCAGNDLQDFLEAAKGGEGLSRPIMRFLYALARATKPLVAGVEGVAVGIGTTMLLHCDYAVAAADGRFMTPFVGLGLVPEAASSLLAPRLMGHARAFSLLVMGQPLDAEGARAAGLVNAVCPVGQAEEEAMAAARRIAALPPDAVAASRGLVRGDVAEIVARIDAEAALFKQRLQSPEARAAFEAFLSRKK